MFPLLTAAIPAAASLFGGMLGQQNQADINSQNIAAQQAINTQNIQNQDMLNAQNIAEQEKFAQQGIQWRAADAKAAGISPLAALGAQTASFSNNVGSTATAPQAQASNAFGAGIASAGQDISRAMQAMQSPEDKAAAVTKTAQDLESNQLDNDLKRIQIANAVRQHTAAGQPPGLPTQVVTKNPDGSYTSGPSRTSEGWAWMNPIAKDQWLWGQEAPQWLGNNVPSEVPHSPGWSNYRNPLTGNYYQMPDISTMFGTMRSIYGNPANYRGDFQP